jgi:hypothetical protein
VPFLKFSRDKRGYENFYLIESTSRGKPRTRLLYWFRTPPNIKVGRTPFDPDMREILEHQNPDVVFDWEAIVGTPIPPPSDTERWRERRRFERAMRAAEAEDTETEGAATIAPQPEEPPLQPMLLSSPPDAVAADRPSVSDEPEGDRNVEDPSVADATGEPVAASNHHPEGEEAAGGRPRRRRRRRRGRKPQPQGGV